jgi:hypothetical protein
MAKKTNSSQKKVINAINFLLDAASNHIGKQGLIKSLNEIKDRLKKVEKSLAKRTS